MQTPSHLAFSLFVWRKVPSWQRTLAIVFGALLPDLAMFAFYGYQKLIGSAESDIWGSYYFLDHWQLVFDLFNSIPIFLAIAVYCHFKKHPIVFLVSASALVHVLFDLPLHHDDAHRHFLPLSNWRFISPVSYWDPRHFGVYAMSVELILSVAACLWVAIGQHARSVRITSAITLGIYFAGMIFAWVMWMN